MHKNRRTFLKRAGAGAAALAGGNAALDQAAAQQPPSQTRQVTAQTRGITPIMTAAAEAKAPEALEVLDNQRPGSDSKDLGPALRRAVEVVKKGQPALVDVVTQPR